MSDRLLQTNWVSRMSFQYMWHDMISSNKIHLKSLKFKVNLRKICISPIFQKRFKILLLFKKIEISWIFFAKISRIWFEKIQIISNFKIFSLFKIPLIFFFWKLLFWSYYFFQTWQHNPTRIVLPSFCKCHTKRHMFVKVWRLIFLCWSKVT